MFLTYFNAGLRIFDIKDVFNRTLWRLQGGRTGPADSKTPLVLVLRAGLDAELAAGFITATMAGALVTLPAWGGLLVAR